eukprot:248049-Hanusia_phi.AAC.3
MPVGYTTPSPTTIPLAPQGNDAATLLASSSAGAMIHPVGGACKAIPFCWHERSRAVGEMLSMVLYSLPWNEIMCSVESLQPSPPPEHKRHRHDPGWSTVPLEVKNAWGGRLLLQGKHISSSELR